MSEPGLEMQRTENSGRRVSCLLKPSDLQQHSRPAIDNLQHTSCAPLRTRCPKNTMPRKRYAPRPAGWFPTLMPVPLLSFSRVHHAAELTVALRALQMHPTGKVAICSDSEYGLLGVRGAAKRWKIKGWVGSCGPVSNICVWECCASWGVDWRTSGPHTRCPPCLS